MIDDLILSFDHGLRTLLELTRIGKRDIGFSTTVCDRNARDMLNLFHPFCISETGKNAGASREFMIPADWQPPLALRFYCADDYFADPQNHKPGKLGTESFFEHRFTQVLINEAVIWERDVVDENQHGSPTIFEVDLTPHATPGKAFWLTFRVLDRVSTRQRNPQDVWFIGGTWYAAAPSTSTQNGCVAYGTLPKYSGFEW